MINLTELKEKALKATPDFEVSFPPDNYSSEWDLLHCPRRRFKSLAEANEFAESRKNKRVPVYGQPSVREILPAAIEVPPDVILTLIEALEGAREVLSGLAVGIKISERFAASETVTERILVTRETEKARDWLAKYGKD
jgi:hypothetical protein